MPVKGDEDRRVSEWFVVAMRALGRGAAYRSVF
jgi:hypothetical protein